MKNHIEILKKIVFVEKINYLPLTKVLYRPYTHCFHILKNIEPKNPTELTNLLGCEPAGVQEHLLPPLHPP